MSPSTVTATARKHNHALADQKRLCLEVHNELALATNDAKKLNNIRNNLVDISEKLKRTFEERENELCQWEDTEQDLQELSISQENSRRKMEEALAQLDAILSPTPRPLLCSQLRGAVPVMRLQAFDGSVAQWHSFWQNFQAIIGGQGYSAFDKLYYLKGQLKGDPLHLANSFPDTAESYEHIVEMLKKRYGDTKAYVRELTLKLMRVKTPKHRAKDLLEFQTLTESAYRTLKNLRPNMMDGAEQYQVNQLKAVLYPETLKLIRYHSDGKAESMEEFSKGLSDTIRELEEHERTTSISSLENAPKKDQNPQRNSGATGRYPHERWHKGNIGTYSVEVKPGTQGNPTTSTGPGTVTRMQMDRCLMCEGEHSHYQCPNYQSVEERLTRLGELGRCKRCLGNHETSDCNTKLRICWKCKQGPHHAYLCQHVERHNPGFELATQSTSVLSIASAEESTSTALPTAEATVIHKSRKQKTRLFFDLGAQHSFIHSSLARQLQLKPYKQCHLVVKGFTGVSPETTFPMVKLTIRLGRSHHSINALVTDQMPEEIYIEGLSQAVSHLKEAGVRLADPNVTTSTIKDIRVLIGADHFFKFVGKQITEKDRITLLSTPNGYMLTGSLPEQFRINRSSNTTVTSVIVAKVAIAHNPIPADLLQHSEEETEVPKLWELESIGIQSETYSPEEAFAYEAYQKSVKYEKHQYWVRLPWKVNKPHLPTNYILARNRLRCTLNKLEKNEEHLKQYSKIIQDQEERGFIEKVPDAQVIAASHYLPHLAVIKDSKTTPVRIVFDCSAKQKASVSLNDCLYAGPSLTEKLGKILLNFRSNPYAFAADISKAFLRVGLQEEDRDYTRFLWHKEPSDPQSNLITYRFRSVLFGATSSPFLLQATLNHHLDKSKSPLAEKIRESLYVDNLQGTMSSEDELLQFFTAANKIMQDANMPLQEWCSNSNKLQQMMQGEDPLRNQKLLGMIWNVETDTLTLRPVSFEAGRMTKRVLLSNLSKIFDPLGLLTPLTIQGKMLMQETWTLNIGWDDELPEEIQKSWNMIVKQTENYSHITFQRNVCEEGRDYDLHVFCDASTKAYGAAAYVADDKHNPRLIMSKARVAPLKTKTLPQLELTALYIGSKLHHYIKEVLAHISFRSVYIWSDSEVALLWVRNNNSKEVYVRNRVAEIQRLSGSCIFQHVDTKGNPADLLTRGQSVKHIMETTLWQQGPLWLKDKQSWPVQKAHVTTHCQAITATDQSQLAIQGNRYSSLNKLLRITQMVFKFINKRLNQPHMKVTPLEYWVKTVQEEMFSLEVSYLRDGQGRSPELIKKLGLFLEDNIVRCSGRLHNADLTYAAKFPILLPKKHWFTKLVIERIHKQILHGGARDTLCELRENYWVPQGLQMVKSTIHRCFVCKLLEGRRCSYPAPPPLPKDRVSNLAPFEVTGVDYTGALRITDPENGNPLKVYVVLFTCANTRAIHLELAVNLTAEHFLSIFRRFAARRSCPRVMISDNGTNFKLGANLLHQLMEDERIQESLEAKRCTWRFIAPRAPWQGGFYERMVGLVKSCLKRTLYKRKVSIEDLYTVIAEVENRINNRPLTYVPSDLDEPEALTPSHLLHGRRLSTVPTVVINPREDPDYLDHGTLNERYHHITKILTRWQNMWQKDYLLSLREKFYGASQPGTPPRKLKEDDVVLVENAGPRSGWALGRIVETYPDQEGQVRLVKLKTKGGLALRTVEKLVPLECEVEESSENPCSDTGEEEPVGVPETEEEPVDKQKTEGEAKRPMRRAAARFRDKLRNMIGAGELN